MEKPNAQDNRPPVAGKHLTFMLGDGRYGVGISQVREILGQTPVTRVPRAPRCVKGVINLRGMVMPVVELKTVFGMERGPSGPAACVIVTQTEYHGHVALMGLAVDAVTEVIQVAPEQLEPPPDFGQGVDIAYIRAVAKIGAAVCVLLDVDRILSLERLRGGPSATDNL